MHHMVFSSSSCTCIVACHLGTLDVRCVDVEHVMTELNHKTVTGGPIPKMDGLPGVHDWTGNAIKLVQTN